MSRQLTRERPRRLAQPRQPEDGQEQRLVLDLGRIERRALRRREQAGEGRKREPRLTAPDAAEDNLHRLPEVREAIVRAALHRPLAQPLQAVALRVEMSRGLGRRVGMEQSALLHREQEDEPVDKAQELLEVRRLRQRAVLQRGAKRAVVGMREKPLAECDQRILNAFPQVLARARPLLAAGGAPDVERAFGGRLAGFAESRFVREQPERGEVGVPFLR